MTYLQLAAWVLAATVLLSIALVLLAGRRGPHLGAVALTVLVLLALTAVFDTIMIASGLFHYADPQLLGIHIGLAPLEDFAYPLAGALLLPTLWAALRARRGARERDGQEHG